MSTLADLQAQGQSPWLDYIRRSLLTTGELERKVSREGLTGLTANPSIFEKAIAGSHDYDDPLRELLAHEPHLGPTELYERLAVDDVRRAADVLRPVFDRTHGNDGFVSLEVGPELAHDTAGTVAEAKRLWAEVARPNLLVKVPGTGEGVPAIEELIASGINVNVTLLFSLSQYEAVAQAYLRGLARAPDPARVASVASIFVSRIDTAVDRVLDSANRPPATALRGKVAIANCRVIYARYREIFEGPGFAAFVARGGRPQRLLWASTSTKDPRYRDTLYVEELVGPNTVDTMPPATLTAFEDHGRVRGDTLTPGLARAREELAAAASVGVDLEPITRQLQTEGVQLFAAAFGSLLGSLASKKEALLQGRIGPASWQLAGERAGAQALQERWQTEHVPERFWKEDPTLWPEAPPAEVSSRMGWLHLPELMHDQVDRLTSFADEVRAEGYRQVVVLGMGGSSLAPDVLRAVFGSRPGYPQLHVLDTTHPDAIVALRRELDPVRTLFLVSSKSGTTVEPLSLYRYFAAEVRAAGKDVGPHFAAITDPGTPLERQAEEEGFRATFRALPTVGGRYSALTHFGMVPAALIGLDVRGFLDRAWTMSEACAPTIPVVENPGLALGAVLGELGSRGKDKLTFWAAGSLRALPVWLEQLVAESTGKLGKGLVPVVDEPPTEAARYGSDRVFVEIQEAGRSDETLAGHTSRLEAAGFPVIRVRVPDPISLGEEFFRWEVAVASAGRALGIDPYDQPDVELAKELARQAMSGSAGASPEADVETVAAGAGGRLPRALSAWMALARPGDYVAIQAYLAPRPEVSQTLQAIRRRLLERLGLATTFGYGPRFLHSTGQLHKGGPNTGLFLQLVDQPSQDLAVPGTDYTFAQLIRAQSLGDYRALRQKGRRVLRVDLQRDVPGGLHQLAEALDA